MSQEIKRSPLQLNENLLWIYCLIAQEKFQVVLDMLVSNSAQGEPPFFSVMGSIDNDQQKIELVWQSLEKDTQVLAELIEVLSRKTRPTHKQIKELLLQSPVFMAMDSSRILPTTDQSYKNGQLIKPFRHVSRVATTKIDKTFWSQSDQLALRLLFWLHDIGKMAGVNFLPEITKKNIQDWRSKLKEKYGKDESKHTHPKHAYVGTAILEKLFAQLEASFPEAFEKIHQDIPMILAVTFHHHDFLYTGEEKDLETLLWREVNARLVPTLPEDRPDLVIRFFLFLCQFRLADISATPSHHRHWKGNYDWMVQLPGLLRQRYADEQSLPYIKKLEKLLENLPHELH